MIILTILLTLSVILNVSLIYYFRHKINIMYNLQDSIKDLQEAIRTKKPEELVGKLVDFSLLLKELTNHTK